MPAVSSKHQQQHPGITLTSIYNVLEKLRRIDYAPRSATADGDHAIADNPSTIQMILLPLRIALLRW